MTKLLWLAELNPQVQTVPLAMFNSSSRNAQWSQLDAFWGTKVQTDPKSLVGGPFSILRTGLVLACNDQMK